MEEACSYLVTDIDGTYIDGTLGGGGHTAEILKRLSPRGKVYSFDKDIEAIEHCKLKFESELSTDSPRLTIIEDCYSKACSLFDNRGVAAGILLDLGVSSRQLDESRRGFSYRVDSPLSMKFAPHGRTAEDLINAAKEEELDWIFRYYGEEPAAGAIARRISQLRRAFPFKTTFDLVNVVDSCVSPKNKLKTLSRVFQAIRIAVNDELQILQYTLSNILPVLSVNARIVIISYHSLEDRIVKTFFKENEILDDKPKNKYKALSEPNEIIHEPDSDIKEIKGIKIITKKPLIPSDNEISYNPRSRSAKMRVGEVVVKKESRKEF